MVDIRCQFSTTLIHGTWTLNMVLVHYILYYYCTIFYSKSNHNRMAMQCNAVTTITVTTSDLKHLLFPGSCVPSLIPHSHFPWFLLSSYLNLILRKMIYSPSEKPKISVSLLLLIYIIHITYTPKNHLTHLIFHITVITGRM